MGIMSSNNYLWYSKQITWNMHLKNNNLIVHNALELLDSGNSSQLSITEEISDKVALTGISKNGHKQHISKKKEKKLHYSQSFRLKVQTCENVNIGHRKYARDTKTLSKHQEMPETEREEKGVGGGGYCIRIKNNNNNNNKQETFDNEKERKAQLLEHSTQTTHHVAYTLAVWSPENRKQTNKQKTRRGPFSARMH